MKALMIFLLLVSGSAIAQDSISLKKAITDLDIAFLSKDTAKIARLLDDACTYGHSTGWTENKKEVIADISSGLLEYRSLHAYDMSLQAKKNWASARMYLNVQVARNGKEANLKLYVLQVWINVNNEWKLVARQGAKIE